MVGENHGERGLKIPPCPPSHLRLGGRSATNPVPQSHSLEIAEIIEIILAYQKTSHLTSKKHPALGHHASESFAAQAGAAVADGLRVGLPW